MYKIGDLIIYKKEVCKILDFKEKHFNNNDYYVIQPITDNTLNLQVPTNNPYIRDLITKKEVEEIINKIPNIEIIDSDDKILENEYKNLLNNATHTDLIKIIKTTYIRNKKRVDTKRKISDKDTYCFELAEKYLYNEISIVLNMTYEETKKYIINKVNQII